MDKLRIFSRKTQTFEIQATGEKVRGRKGFAVNRDSASFEKTAKEWSTAEPHLQKSRTKLQLLLSKKKDLFEDVSNDPIALRIIGLEYRGNGGRAYKVITRRGYVFDFREEPLLEAITTVGIGKDGYLKGEYVWVVVGSQMRLVRVDSTEHKIFLQREENKTLKKIPNKDLKVGCVYHFGIDNHRLFMGWAHHQGEPNRKKGVWYPIEDVKDLPELLANFEEKLDLHSLIIQPTMTIVKVHSGPHLFEGVFIDEIREKAISKIDAMYFSHCSYMFRSLCTLTPRKEPIVIDPRLSDYF